MRYSVKFPSLLEADPLIWWHVWREKPSQRRGKSQEASAVSNDPQTTLPKWHNISQCFWIKWHETSPHPSKRLMEHSLALALGGDLCGTLGEAYGVAKLGASAEGVGPEREKKMMQGLHGEDSNLRSRVHLLWLTACTWGLGCWWLWVQQISSR